MNTRRESTPDWKAAFMQTYGVIGFFALLVFFLVIKGVYLVQRSKRRVNDLTEWCKANRFSFSRESHDALDAAVKEMPQLFEGRDPTIFNVVIGEIEGINVTIFDYEYTTGSRGTNSTQVVQTVFQFQCDVLHLPRFSLERQAFMHNLAIGLGLQDIHFDSHPLFSKQFLLRGGDEHAIRELFTAEVLDFYEQFTNFGTVGHGDRFLVWQDRKRIPAKELHSMVRQGISLTDLFKH